MTLVEFSFGGLDLVTDDRLLAPRDWTAAQSEWAAELLATGRSGPVLELCAGAGHIGLAAVRGTERHLVAIDRESVAVDRVRANAERLELADRVETRCCAIDDGLAADERFALIIADPPWVPRSAIGEHPQDPPAAIDGGPDGLTIARECVQVISRHLDMDGAALLQLGTREQADRLELPDDLVVDEVREYPRGVVVCLRSAEVSRAAEP